jgi:dGTPase
MSRQTSFAVDSSASRGRLFSEDLDPIRTPFRRDCDRIIHSTAFRRLAYKTQVFLFDEGDHYRNRLTHTLEVTQVSRGLARALDLDEDLAEALALAHDLGHPPFGHAGERALDECLSVFGGFDHNVQTLRVVTALEHRYPEFEGLNLSWETLEGLVKHNGPLTNSIGNTVGRYAKRSIPDVIATYCASNDLKLSSYPSAEAQVAGIADDIAYNAHDIDDGLRAGLFQVEEIATVQPVGEIMGNIRRRYPGLQPDRLVHELVRKLIGQLISDVTNETRRRVGRFRPHSADDVRSAPGPIVGFSPAMAAADRAIKGFLSPRMYYHPRVSRVVDSAKNVVRDLFARYSAHPGDLPAEWSEGLDGLEEALRARRIADFIAGMTDRFALAEHARLFDTTPELR